MQCDISSRSGTIHHSLNKIITRMTSKLLKLIKLLTHLVLIVLISYLFTNIKSKVALNILYERFAHDIRHVLLWNEIEEIDMEGQHLFFKKHCRFTNCYITTKKQILGDIRLFDAIIFNSEYLDKNTQLPKRRSKHQKFIFFSKVSAQRTPICDERFDNYFSWSWTYKTSSEIKIKFYSILNSVGEDVGGSEYFKWMNNLKDINSNLKDKLKSKSKAVAWIVDDCKTLSKREVFAEELKRELCKYNLTIDIYGKCGDMKCKRKTMMACYWKLKRLYFFYLALEDSMVEDFVTAEVVHGYASNTVPVVYGGANYSKFLPPDSFIDGSKLGPEVTAKQIYDSIKDKQKYYNFFKWKNHYIIRPNENVIDVCDMCHKLNNLEWLNFNTIYPEFREWWNPEAEGNRCFTNSRNLL